MRLRQQRKARPTTRNAARAEEHAPLRGFVSTPCGAAAVAGQWPTAAAPCTRPTEGAPSEDSPRSPRPRHVAAAPAPRKAVHDHDAVSTAATWTGRRSCVDFYNTPTVTAEEHPIPRQRAGASVRSARANILLLREILTKQRPRTRKRAPSGKRSATSGAPHGHGAIGSRRAPLRDLAATPSCRPGTIAPHPRTAGVATEPLGMGVIPD